MSETKLGQAAMRSPAEPQLAEQQVRSPRRWEGHRHHLHAGIWRGVGEERERKFFNSVTDLEKCERPSKAQLGAFPASGYRRRECQRAAAS